MRLVKLYIKTHNITGLKYFGKTTISDYHKYQGSGLYWNLHIKKHNYDVTTRIIGTYDESDPNLKKDAIMFSIENNIVESKEWANLKIENGHDGGWDGYDGAGLVVVKDVNNNNMQVSVDDERYVSGELIHVNTGSTRTKKQKDKKYDIDKTTGDLIYRNNIDKRHKTLSIINTETGLNAYETNGATVKKTMNKVDPITGLSGHDRKGLTLSKHLKTKIDEVCEFCEFTCRQKGHMTIHQRHCDKNPNKIPKPTFNCKFCQKPIKNINGKTIHENRCQLNPNTGGV